MMLANAAPMLLLVDGLPANDSLRGPSSGRACTGLKDDGGKAGGVVLDLVPDGLIVARLGARDTCLDDAVDIGADGAVTGSGCMYSGGNIDRANGLLLEWWSVGLHGVSTDLRSISMDIRGRREGHSGFVLRVVFGVCGLLGVRVRRDVGSCSVIHCIHGPNVAVSGLEEWCLTCVAVAGFRSGVVISCWARRCSYTRDRASSRNDRRECPDLGMLHLVQPMD